MGGPFLPKKQPAGANHGSDAIGDQRCHGAGSFKAQRATGKADRKERRAEGMATVERKETRPTPKEQRVTVA